MGNLIDLTGQKFGRLTVLERDWEHQKKNNSHHRKTYWICRCSCGQIVTVAIDHLKSGHTCSCGCLKESHGELVIKKLLQ